MAFNVDFMVLWNLIPCNLIYCICPFEKVVTHVPTSIKWQLQDRNLRHTSVTITGDYSEKQTACLSNTVVEHGCCNITLNTRAKRLPLVLTKNTINWNTDQRWIRFQFVSGIKLCCVFMLFQLISFLYYDILTSVLILKSLVAIGILYYIIFQRSLLTSSAR
jgi:hypothetical protein